MALSKFQVMGFEPSRNKPELSVVHTPHAHISAQWFVIDQQHSAKNRLDHKPWKNGNFVLGVYSRIYTRKWFFKENQVKKQNSLKFTSSLYSFQIIFYYWCFMNAHYCFISNYLTYLIDAIRFLWYSTQLTINHENSSRFLKLC